MDLISLRDRQYFRAGCKVSSRKRRQIADLGIAKAVVGEPRASGDNFIATFRVVVENTGTVDLADLSLIEDLPSQLGPAFVNAGNLVLATPPSNPGSSIAVDSAGFNGRSSTELLDVTQDNLLQVGDSFVLTLDIEINPDFDNGQLQNQVTGTGSAVDDAGNPYLTAAGGQLAALDLSDAGDGANGNNPGVLGDNGTWSDPTIVRLPTFGGGVSGSAANLPFLPGVFNRFANGLLTTYTGSPSTIYSGIPVDGNANPISLDSGRPVTGGYSSANGMGDAGDCGCVTPVNPCDPCGNPVPTEGRIIHVPLEETQMHGDMNGDMNAGEVPYDRPIIIEGDAGVINGGTEEMMDVSENESDEEATDGVAETIDNIRSHQAGKLGKPSFLKRFTNWLRA